MNHVSLNQQAPVSLVLHPVDLLSEALEALTYSDWQYADTMMSGRTMTPLSGVQALYYAMQNNQMNRGRPTANTYPPLLSR